MKNLTRILVALLVFMVVFACEKNAPAPAENTVVENTPEEETPEEESPVEETPAEESPEEETPVEETPVEETPEENQAENPINEEIISGKWLIQETGDFVSVEFNKSGNYIIVKTGTASSDEVVLFGTYEIINNNTIVLADFGTITASNIEENSISYTITLNTAPNSETNVTAIKQTEIAASTRTELFCRTWKLVELNGVSVAGTEYELTVLFSEAGTYFVEYLNPEDENDGGLAHWNWKDEGQTKLCYSWEGPAVCDGDDEVEIIALSSSELRLLENFEDGESELYVLRPYDRTTSSTARKAATTFSKEIKRGLLRR